MQKEILTELEDLRDETEFIINNEEVIENKHVENYLRSLERIRYNIFNKIKLKDKYEVNEQDKINYLNNQIQDLSDYISKWSHEAKLPLASLRLMNERNENVVLKNYMLVNIKNYTFYFLLYLLYFSTFHDLLVSLLSAILNSFLPFCMD